MDTGIKKIKRKRVGIMGINVGDKVLFACHPRCGGVHPYVDCKPTRTNGYRVLCIHKESNCATVISNNKDRFSINLGSLILFEKGQNTFGYTKGLLYV